MSTPSVIARQRGDGWEGRYVHSDGYPTGMGAFLHGGAWKLPSAYEQFGGDTETMLRFLVDEHPAGWSCIFDANLGKAKVVKNWRRKDAVGMSVRCYCHSGDAEEAKLDWLITNENVSGYDVAWVYVVSRAGVAVLAFESASTFVPVAFVRWTDTDVDWGVIECGEKFERCGHVASYHFPEAQGRVGIRAYLGIEPLQPRDAIGVVINGIEYALTGSGGMTPKSCIGADARTRYAVLNHTRPQDCVWVASTKAVSNGRRSEKPIYGYDEQGELFWLSGVEPIYPTLHPSVRSAA